MECRCRRASRWRADRHSPPRRIGAPRAGAVRVRGSTLFLAGYLLYHSFGDGPAPYGGPVAWLYYAILISHIILAVTIVPLALVTLRLGWTFHPRHRTVARVTFPIWLYVSVTGVVIFVFLYWLDA